MIYDSFDTEEYQILFNSDKQQCIEYLQNLINKGDKTAKAYMSRLLRDGSGVEKNLSLAIQLMQESIDSVQWARIELVDMLIVRKSSDDYKKIISILYECVNNKVDERRASLRLSKIYHDGLITKKNIDLSLFFMNKAVDNNLDIDYIKLLIERGKSSDLKEAFDLLNKMDKKDSKVAELISLLMLGCVDVNSNLDEAFEILYNSYGGITKFNSEKLIFKILCENRMDLLDKIDFYEYCGLDRKERVCNAYVEKKSLCLICKKENSKEKIICTLYKDKKAIKRLNLTKDEIRVPLTDSGVYYARFNIQFDGRIIECHSMPIQYFSEETKLSLTKFKKEKIIEVPRLNYCLRNFPYNDFLLTNCKKLVFFYNFHKQIVCKKTENTVNLFYSNDEQSHLGNVNLLFSGSVIIDGIYYRGGTNLNKDTKPIDGYTGNYVSIYKINGEVVISTDYFGLGKIYYYYDGDDYVISNNYYLLLLGINKCGIDMSFDIDVVKSIFYYDSGILSEQPVSNKMVMHGINLLPVDKKIVISDKLNFVDSEIVEVKDDAPVDYKKSVVDSANDIISNLKAVLNCDDYRNYIFDVTGGIDSRIVACAYSRIKTNKKIFASTRGVGKEYDIGHFVASIANMHYDDTIDNFNRLKIDAQVNNAELIDYKAFIHAHLSQELNSFDSSTVPVPFKLNHTMHINGNAGEIISRPYMHMFQFKKTTGGDIEEYLHSYNAINSWKTMSGYEELGKGFDKCLFETMDDCPFTNIHEKIEYVFLLLFRSRFHFDWSFSDSVSTCAFSPLISKKTYVAFRHFLRKEVSFKFSFDLLNELNRDISSVEYEDLMNSIMRTKIFKDRFEPVTSDVSQQIVKKTPDIYFKDKQSITTVKHCSQNHDTFIYSEIKALFHYIVNNCNELSAIFLPIWHYIERYNVGQSSPDESRRLWRLYKKLSLLVYSHQKIDVSVTKFDINDVINFDIYNGFEKDIIIGKKGK